MKHRRTTTVLIALSLASLASPAFAAAKHHRSEMDRWVARLHHREAKEQHWATESDEKAQAQEEKHATHQGKWEKMMDAIGRPQAQPAD